jgi:predicted transcriptional regulator
VIPISIKNNIVISHIESLPIGAKISVRGLAAELKVSEGTVYKGIKDAEAMGLVVTRPKAGTFRVDTSISEETGDVTVAEIAKLLGLNIAAGGAGADNVITKIIVCDSDEAELLRHLGECRAENALCIAGNRPDLQLIAVTGGANLLITGGSRPTDYQLIQAEKRGVCILTSIQSTYTLIRLFDNQFTDRQRFDGGTDVAEWMQTPDFLYRNDIVADWHKFYRQNLGGMNQYPLVDDELNICGGLDISRAFAATPSQRLSALTADGADFLTVDKADSMHDVTKRMILSGGVLAAVTSGGKMEGVISADDLLRYYMYSDSRGRGFQAEPFLTFLPEPSSKTRFVYGLTVPLSEHEELPNLIMSIMLAAAGRHVESAGCKNYRVASGTFYSPERAVLSDGLMLTTSLNNPGGASYIVEAEIHDDERSFAKAILMYSQSGEQA